MASLFFPGRHDTLSIARTSLRVEAYKADGLPNRAVTPRVALAVWLPSHLLFLRPCPLIVGGSGGVPLSYHTADSPPPWPSIVSHGRRQHKHPNLIVARVTPPTPSATVAQRHGGAPVAVLPVPPSPGQPTPKIGRTVRCGVTPLHEGFPKGDIDWPDHLFVRPSG
jgi:hypothetical protein